MAPPVLKEIAMVVRRALVGVVSFALLFAGCTNSSGSEASEFREDFDVTITLRPTGDEVNLPTLDPPLSREETRALRDGFSWEGVDEIPETDNEGRPTTSSFWISPVCTTPGSRFSKKSASVGAAKRASSCSKATARASFASRSFQVSSSTSFGKRH